jgi:lysophospholipase L1-like esterase
MVIVNKKSEIAKRKRRIKTLLGRFLLLSAATLLSLLVMEGVSRLFLSPIDYLKPSLVHDDLLGHAIAPHTAGHDAWGFRNKAIPERCDIVAIGDSQTYGVSATARDSWPAILQRLTGKSVYNLALGGFAAPQYRHLLQTRALSLRPSLVIVGCYCGNDLAETYLTIYGNDHWQNLRRNNFTLARTAAGDTTGAVENAIGGTASRSPMLELKPAGAVMRILLAAREWLAHHSVLYRAAIEGSFVGDLLRRSQTEYGYSSADIATFEDESNQIRAGFTPLSRLAALNLDDPRNAEGLRLNMELLHQMSEITSKAGIGFLVALIPTKELVFASYIENNEAMNLSQTIDQVLYFERRATELLKADLAEHGIAYVDLLPSLQHAVGKEQIYPINCNGHPTGKGYAVIAQAIASHLESSFQP